jgi:2-oxoglutarate ferredoxin oxidoreductase subunit delta
MTREVQLFRKVELLDEHDLTHTLLEVFRMDHGRIIIDSERCKGCELCLPTCPPQVISLAEQLNSNGYRPALFLDQALACTGCALCAVVCPDGSITVFRDVPQNKKGQKGKDLAGAKVRSS